MVATNTLISIAEEHGLDLNFVTRWDPPEGDDLRPLIAMPNLPRPTHGEGMQPRTIFGATTWNKMRRRCYQLADDTCEICGDRPENTRFRHCLERGTEVLTINGWKPIEHVTTSDTVAQFSPENESISWINPTSTISKYEEKIYRFGYKKGFSVGVSSGHRMLVQNGKNGKYATIEAKDLEVGKWQKIPAAGRGHGSDGLSVDERLLIALQADGSVEKTASGAIYCKIRVKKKRKIERLKWLAKECSFTTHQGYYKTKDHGEYFRLSFTLPYDGKNFFDTFKTPQMSYKKANEFINELVKWDGWEGIRNGFPGKCYYSSEKSNIDFVQAVCSQAGLGSHLTVTYRKVRDFGTHISRGLKPSYNLEIKKNNSYGLTTMKKELVDYNDKVFCISVPSSYFVARTKGGDVFITGNCHEVFSIDYEKGTSTFVRGFCVCALDHLSCIHNGRALTLYSKGASYMTAEKLLTGAEKAFSIVRDYNKDHPGADIRLYSTYIEYLKHMELRGPLLNLIKQYDVKFYMEDPKKTAKWKDWRVVVNGKEYHTPYKNEKEWEKAMEQRNYNDTLNKDGLKIKELSAKEVAEEHNKLKGF